MLDHPFLASPLGIFLVLAVGGSFLYLSLASLSYATFFVWKKARFLPDYVANPAELKKAITWGLVSVVGNAVLTAPIHHAIVTGRSSVYYDLDERGLGYFVFSVVVYLFVTETLIYWTHRALHHPVLYKWIHLKHHEFRKPTPFAGVAFNPLDSFLQALPHHLCALFLPVHVGVYLTMLTFVTVWAVAIHDRVSLVRWSALLYTGHHTIHHHYNKYNYGQFFSFWDRWAGTYKSPLDQPERFLLPRPLAETRPLAAAE